MRNFKALSLSLDRRLRPFLDAPITCPRRGWARSIREAIGMTKAQLASRLGLGISAIARLERNEARGAVTLESLRRLARGLDCHLVYALVPKGSRTLDELVRDHAERTAGDACEGPLRKCLVEMLAGNGRRDLWR